jgi:beta-fructofuranosidase
MLYKPGWNCSEPGDMDLLVRGDELHMFFLELPSHDRVGHAVSRDGMRWELLPHALHTGEPGEFDDDQIWTMHTFAWQNRYYMLYTALCSQEQGRLQRTGLAVSDDLVRWTKVKHNPVAAPDPRWYEADLRGSGRADWRDPFAWIEDGVIHVLICAHEKDGPFNRRGCVAHVTSTDAQHWTVHEPFYRTGNNTDFEVPTVIRLGGRYYMLGHHVAPQIDVYRVADQLSGPWRRPANDWLLPAPNHAFTPAVFKGRTLVTHWVATPIDWPTGTSAGHSRIITPPKEVVATDAGELLLRSYEPGWDSVAAGPYQSMDLRVAAERVCGGRWQSAAPGAVGGDAAPGMGLLRIPGNHGDFIAQGRIEFRGAVEAGLVWRSDETADCCTRVVITPGRQGVSLQRLTRRTNYNAIGRGCDVLQTNHVPSMAQAVELRVVAWGPYVEVSVDGRVLLVFTTMSRRDGAIGLFVEDGSAQFASWTLRPLQEPPPFSTESASRA